MTEDEMDIDKRTETATISSQQSTVQVVPVRENQPPPQRINQAATEAGNSSDDSFLSAREGITSKNTSKEQLREDEDSDKATVQDEEMEVIEEEAEAASNTPIVQPTVPEAEAETMNEDQDQELDGEESRSESDASSPGKPLQRKSSFTFTALPPRDPLAAKQSFGGRTSHIDVQASRNSTLARSFGSKGAVLGQNDDEEFVENKLEESKAHSKTSTQLLHERINMLGKTKEPRASKSLHQGAQANQAAYPQLPTADPSKANAPADDSDDDWIAPVKPAEQPDARPVQGEAFIKEISPQWPTMHQKSTSATRIPSPTRPDTAVDSRHQKAISVSNPDLAPAKNEVQSNNASRVTNEQEAPRRTS